MTRRIRSSMLEIQTFTKSCVPLIPIGEWMSFSSECQCPINLVLSVTLVKKHLALDTNKVDFSVVGVQGGPARRSQTQKNDFPVVGGQGGPARRFQTPERKECFGRRSTRRPARRSQTPKQICFRSSEDKEDRLGGPRHQKN